MSNSLRDQLIKAGVVTQEQADKAAKEQRESRRNSGRAGASGSRGQRGGAGKGGAAGRGGAAAKGQGSGSAGGRRGRGRRPQQGSGRTEDNSPEAVRARAAAQQRGRDQRAVKALRAAVGGSEKALRDELRRFIAQYDQRSREAADSDEPYNFVHNRKIKRIHIPVAQIEALSTGQLVIVNNDGRYALLPLGPAFTIAEVDRRRIVAAHVTGTDEFDTSAAETAAGATGPGADETDSEASETGRSAAEEPQLPEEPADVPKEALAPGTEPGAD